MKFLKEKQNNTKIFLLTKFLKKLENHQKIQKPIIETTSTVKEFPEIEK